MGWFFRGLAALLVFLTVASGAQAANPYSAAYMVNDSVITNYDIDQRVKLLGALGYQGNSARKDAIQQLIDDRLKMSAARDMGISLAEGALERGIESLAVASGTTAQALRARARGRGVSDQAFNDYYEAQIIWRELVQVKFRALADPTSVDVDNAITAAASATAQSIQIAELALPFAERGEEATLAFAERLSRDLNAGADFATAVQRFSRSPTAENGGVIGWVAPDRLPGNMASQILGLRVGQVSRPIRVSAGVILIKVLASRVEQSPLRQQVSVRYAVLDLSGAANPLAEAKRRQRGMDECRPATSHAPDFGGSSGLFGPVSVDEVPADIALALSRLMPGRSQIVQNGDSVQLVQLCDRTTSLDEQIVDQVRNNVFGTKLGKLAEGYLLELRRGAVIEKR